jgi:hypothetical protein
MRVHARAVAIVAATIFAVPGVAWGAGDAPQGPVTAQTVAAAQAEATTAATASTNAARDAATAQVALDAAKAAATAAANAAAANPTPENVAAAAAASAAQAAAQTNFDAKTAAAAKALADSTAAATNADRESKSFAQLSKGTSTETATEISDPDPQPDNYLHSDNVSLVGHVRGLYSTTTAGKNCPAYNPTKCPGNSALNFLHYENLGYDVMVANGTAGLSIWSLKDPAKPKWIAQVTTTDLATIYPANQSASSLARFWEGENMTVDSRRKLVFMSRDDGTRGQVIIDVQDPWKPKLLAYNTNFQGHTSTCINDCRYLWSVGGPSNAGTQTQGKASYVSVTDIRDALHPFVFGIISADVSRTGVNSGSTHSVDVDFDGVAWVSGSNGVRGWYTSGSHRDYKTGQDRLATPTSPISYGGGRLDGSATSSFMHNAYHMPSSLNGGPAGDVLLATNEDNQTSCSIAGVFVIASLSGMHDADTPAPIANQRMTRYATYSTGGKPGEFHGTVGTTTVGDCSAHWFTVKGNIVALGNYEQGTRFVDISDPRNPQQVGWFRVPVRTADPTGKPDIISSDTAGAYWHGKYVYVADYQRGIDIIKLDDSALRGKILPKACWNACADENQAVEAVNHSTDGGAGASVPATLSLSLGTPATFGAFTPGLAKDYAAQGTANVISTAGDATLTVADPGANAGHLANNAFTLPSVLQAKATSPAGTGDALKDVGGSSAPTSLLTYSGPVSNDPVTVSFQQHIGASDALRTGSYSKTLTFTLSTTTP